MNHKWFVLFFTFVTWNIYSAKATGLDLISATSAYQQEKTIAFCSIVDGLGLSPLEPILTPVGTLIGTILGSLSGTVVSRTLLRALPTQTLRSFALSSYVGFVTIFRLLGPLALLLPPLFLVVLIVALLNGLIAGLVGGILGLLADLFTLLTGSGIRCAMKYGTFL